MKEILLKNGITLLVDDEDYERVSAFKWYTYTNKGKDNFCVRCYEHSSLAKFILGIQDNGRVFKLDGNPHNFQKSNLRLVSHREIAIISQGRRNTYYKFKGVYWDAKKNKWRACIRVHGKRSYLGTFDTETDAAKAYNQAAALHFGRDAYLNKLEA